MTSSLKTEQQLQEDEYWFPYHYVTQFEGGRFTHHFSDSWGINYASTIEFMLTQVGQHDPESIIDIGCGDGRLTREFSLAFPDRRIVGVDYSQQAINLARVMNADRAVEFHSADITTEWTTELFDAASLMEVFEHLPLDRADAFMAGVRACLRLGGRLHLTVPHANKPLEYKHYQHFTTETLLPYLEGHFKIDRVIPFERRSLTYRIIHLSLQNKLFVLHNQRILNKIYSYYKHNLFHCNNEQQCQRLYVQAVAI